MNKIWVILKREYLTRVKNKTFIIMTFLAPVLIGLFYTAIVFVAMKDAGDKTKKNVLYSDHSGFFANNLDSIGRFAFFPAPSNREEALKKVRDENFYAYLEIEDHDLSKIDSARWISRKTLSLMQSEKISDWLSDKIYKERISKLGIRKGQIDSLKPTSSISMIEIDNNGQLKNSSSGIKSGIGFGLALVIYMFIFIYGSMVMRSALEEKTNRIVEVIVSSVKPFQMMMGKILGVALVGLTQFTAWILLSLVAIVIVTGIFGSHVISHAQQISSHVPSATGAMMNNIPQEAGTLDVLTNLPFGQIIATFLIFFVGGFLLYSSMFAAIGSAVNQETDVQQFMFPISIPLVFGFVIAQSAVFQDPNGPMAKIFSIVPLTSPVVMVVRSPFNVPISELLISIGVLFASFIFFVWVTGRIYRIGILMYGKKPTWRELGKWIFRKS